MGLLKSPIRLSISFTHRFECRIVRVLKRPIKPKTRPKRGGRKRHTKNPGGTGVSLPSPSRPWSCLVVLRVCGQRHVRPPSHGSLSTIVIYQSRSARWRTAHRTESEARLGRGVPGLVFLRLTLAPIRPSTRLALAQPRSGRALSARSTAAQDLAAAARSGPRSLRRRRSSSGRRTRASSPRAPRGRCSPSRAT